MLIIIQELDRQNLLNQLYAIVLAIDPEAFQNIYQPLPLVGEDVTALDLNILMERDSYGMTCLHRATFHGDTEGVEKILQNIRRNLSQENEIEEVIANVMIRYEDSFTPFYENLIHPKMDKFMKIVSEKLGSNFVKELVMHKDGEKPVIFNIAERGEEKLLETMLNYLSTKDRKKIQRQVDEYLDKTFQIPSDGNWINNFSFLF